MASVGTIILCGEAVDEWSSGCDRGREHELQADVEGCGWWGVWQDQASGLTKLLCPPS